jgi:hypothetical protein
VHASMWQSHAPYGPVTCCALTETVQLFHGFGRFTIGTGLRANVYLYTVPSGHANSFCICVLSVKLHNLSALHCYSVRHAEIRTRLAFRSRESAIRPLLPLRCTRLLPLFNWSVRSDDTYRKGAYIGERLNCFGRTTGS